ERDVDALAAAVLGERRPHVVRHRVVGLAGVDDERARLVRHREAQLEEIVAGGGGPLEARPQPVARDERAVLGLVGAGACAGGGDRLEEVGGLGGRLREEHRGGGEVGEGDGLGAAIGRREGGKACVGGDGGGRASVI